MPVTRAGGPGLRSRSGAGAIGSTAPADEHPGDAAPIVPAGPALGENSDAIGVLDGAVIAGENAGIAGDMALGERIDTEGAARMAGDTALGVRIDDEETARMAGDAANHTEIMANRGMIGTNVTNIAVNATAIMAEQTARMKTDTMLGGRIDTEASDRMAADDELRGHITTNAGNIMANEMAIGANADNISANAGSIAANMSSIGSNASAISDNRNRIGELSDDPAVVRAGVAASMAPPHRYFALTGSNAALPSPVRRPVGSAARARPVRGVTLRACRPPCPMPQGGPSRRMPARALAQPQPGFRLNSTALFGVAGAAHTAGCCLLASPRGGQRVQRDERTPAWACPRTRNRCTQAQRGAPCSRSAGGPAACRSSATPPRAPAPGTPHCGAGRANAHPGDSLEPEAGATLSHIYTKAQDWGIVAKGTNPCRHVELYRQRGDPFLELDRQGVPWAPPGRMGR